jgi:1,4-alpha-glucan branching enzyme
MSGSTNVTTARGEAVTRGSLITDHDVYLFKEGNHFKLYDKLGSHLISIDGVGGTFFALWAPNAEKVSVIGDFNGWNPESHQLKVRQEQSGIWERSINIILLPDMTTSR